MGKTIFDQFEGYVIPDHLFGKDDIRKEAVRYWTVTITLTSGEVESFYIKAINLQEAQKKAEEYAYMPNLKLKGEWRLLP